jgi:hypothetical protein
MADTLTPINGKPDTIDSQWTGPEDRDGLLQ